MFRGRQIGGRQDACPLILTTFLTMMSDKKPAVSKQAVIVNELGLHARTAGMIARIAEQAADTIWLSRGEADADAASIIDMLTLECPKGTPVSVSAADSADAKIVEQIVALIKNGFEQ